MNELPTFEFKKVLLVEDEPTLGITLEMALRKLGLDPLRAHTKEEALALQRQEGLPPFILLDRGLPDGDGLDLCQQWRNEGYRGGILVLTAAGTLQDRVAGLNRGADDYLPKPFSWEELSARIAALARRIPPPESQAQQNPWHMDPDHLKILGPKGWVELTPLEFKLAQTLMEAKGKIIHRNRLLKEVWGFNLIPKTRTVDHFMGRLRKYFEPNPEAPQHFVTVRGRGYRFLS